MTPDVLSLAEAIEYLRLDGEHAERKLRKLVAQRKVGHIKEGRTLTFPREALERYVSENTVPAVAPNPFGLTDGALRNIQRERR
jgi:hypothetical protein